MLIVLDEEKEIEELPLPLRVLIAYGEIFKQLIKIIQSDGRLFERKKKRLYWEDSDVQSYMKNAKIRRQTLTQNIKCLRLDPEYGDLIFGDECYDAIDIPFELAKRLSSWFALCYEINHFNYEYSPAELNKLEDQIDHEEKYLIDELQKVLPHVVIS